MKLSDFYDKMAVFCFEESILAEKLKAPNEAQRLHALADHYFSLMEKAAKEGK